MDALSSSFLSTFPTQSPTTAPKLNPGKSLSVFSVRIEERPTTQTPSKTTRPPPQPLNQTPSSYSSSPLPTKPNSPTQPTLPAVIFNLFDDLINTFVDPPLRPSVDPKHVLSSNFAPVTDELPPTECQVIQGSLPPCLDGAYIRNGPNPQYLPRGPYHLFDGYGMLHSLRISQGRAVLCSRYVKTACSFFGSSSRYPKGFLGLEINPCGACEMLQLCIAA